MNKTAIKNYAIWARVQLIEAVKQRAFEFEVDEKGENKYDIDSVGGRLLSETEKEQRQKLLELICQKGYEQVMEEAAYTWFNRFIALRFMEVNGYLPSKVRVFTDENGAFKPEIMKQAMSVELDGLDRNYVLELLDKQNNEELYKYLLITQCNALNKGLPDMFEKIGAWTELLFPKNLLRDDSVIARMIADIDEDDWKEQVEIIGWLYQYYNTELKDKVFSRPSGQKIRKEDVPAATQLYTPHWIVRYMVENSLGRTLLENLESGKWNVELEKATAEKMGWKYYLPEAEQTPEAAARLHNNSTFNFSHSTFLDPCMGSGHILVYAFEVLMQIYTSQGYTQRDAAQKIVENNLYGLELDDRASQLAYFAVMMKARSYDRRFLTRGIRPMLCSIQESNDINPDYLELFGELKETARKLCDEFIDAKEYGSILNLKITAEEIAQLEEKCSEIIDENNYYDNFYDTTCQAGIRTYLPALIRQAKIMIRKYDVVCTNPPYMGGSFSPELDAYIKKYYADSKSDLFAVFIEKCGAFTKAGGYYAMITQHAWMFLSSYEKLRKKLQYSTTVNMAHLGARAFDEINGEVVQTTAFVNKNQHINNYSGTYARLIDGKRENEKSAMFLSRTYNYTANADNFSKIPGSPVAYWVNENVFNCFENTRKIEDISYPRQGLATGNNDRFLRMWHEVINTDIKFNAESHEEFFKSCLKYIPYNKGGTFRKWFANMEFVIRFDKRYYNILATVGNHLPSRDFYFKESITWSKVTSGGLSMRYIPKGSTFDVAGCSIFCDKNLMYLLGFVNTCVMQALMNILSQTLNYEVGSVKKIPIIFDKIEEVESIVKDNVRLSKEDLTSFETHFEFERHPLV